MAKIYYLPDEKEVSISPKESILSVSLKEGIPHTHACGGHAKCTTCRVVVLEGGENCAPRNKTESGISKKLNFTCDIRLACQTKVTGDVKVRRLILDQEDIAIVKQMKENPTALSLGEEKELAILFCDITGFTSFSEEHLSYDVIHILNRYFLEMEKIVHQYKGSINNTMGDGFLALFGENGSNNSALQSVKAALKMLEDMAHFNEYLQTNYKSQFKLRIGIHFGSVVLGSLGTTGGSRRTVIGDSVNLASRIETMNKEMGTQLVISETVYQQVKDSIEIGKHCRGTIRGKTGEYPLYEVLALK